MRITDIDQLSAHYGAPVPLSLDKVADHITPKYHEWIAQARFAILSTVGPEGTDASPRGDDGPVVRIDGAKHLLMPDWMGNNRIDSLRNIVRDPRVSLMFMVPGCSNVVRVNGQASIRVDAELRASFDRGGKQPRSVIEVEVGEIYFQCAKALMRSGLWSGRDDSAKVPTTGDLIKEFRAGFDGASYDRDYAENAKPRMW